MNRSKMIRVVVFSLVVYVFIGVSIRAQSEIEDYKLFTQSLDAIGGRASSTDFSLRIGSGGQPGVIGTSQGTNLYGLQGYVNTAAFQHGDCNADGQTSLPDIVYLINYTLKRGPPPVPLETGDMDCLDNDVDLADVVSLINYLFREGVPPCNL